MIHSSLRRILYKLYDRLLFPSISKRFQFFKKKHDFANSTNIKIVRITNIWTIDPNGC